MNIFVVNIVLTLVLGFFLINVQPNKTKKKLYIALMTVNWIFISGLRGLSVGADTISYLSRYNITRITSWKELINNFYTVYVGGEGKDPGYSMFEKLTQIFSTDYQVYLIIIAVCFFVGMASWIYRYSKDPLLSYLIFSSFLFGFYAVTGIRQTLATVLVVFIGTKFIEKRKLFWFLVVVAIAFTIHKSSICFLPFYFLSRMPVNKKTITAVIAAMPVMFIFNQQIFFVLGYLLGYEYDELENRGAYGFTFMYVAVTLVMVMLLRYIKMQCPHYKMFYNALLLGLMFLPIVFVNPTTMRVVQYFSLFLMISVPEIIYSFSKRSTPLVYTAVVSVLLIASNVYSYEYVFFWQ